MSSAKIILLGELGESVQAIPTAVYFLKLARRSGHLSLERTFYLGDLKVRVLLDPYAGDKVYIEPTPCQAIKFSGLLDTYRAKLRAPLVTPRYLVDDQLKMEYRLPLSATAPVPTAKLLYGVRPKDVTAVIVDELAGDVAPVATQGYDGDLYTVTGTNDVYLKELRSWRLLEQFAENPKLTTELPVEKTIVSYFDNLGDPLDPPVVDIDYSKFKETYQALFPSRFTGHMRKVVQATFASEAWVNFATTLDVNGNPVAPAAPVNYIHGDSWGCIKSGGRYHFIQITSDSVYLVPSKYCTHIDSTTGEDVVVLRSAEVSSRVKIGTIPAGLGSSWDTEIGWAFSYTSLEASIVCSNTAQIGQDSYVTTSLLTLTFGLDVAGIPVSATTTATAPEIIYYPAFMNKSYVDGGHALFNKVTMGQDKTPINVTVDFGLQRLGFPSPPNYRADEVPMYVYYTKAGRQLCTYSYRTEAGSSSVTTIPAARTRYRYNSSNGTYDTVVNDQALVFQSSPWGTDTRGGFTQWGFSCGGSSLPKAEGSVSRSLTSWRLGDAVVRGEGIGNYTNAYWWLAFTYTVTPTPPALPYDVTTSYNMTAEDTPRYFVYQISDVKNGGGTTTNSVLTLPVNDREAALILSSTETASSTGTYSTQTTVALAGGETGTVETSPNPSIAYGDIEASMELSFRLQFSIDCGSNPTYSYKNANSYSVPGFNDSLGFCITVGFAPTYNYYTFFPPGPNVSACGVTYYGTPANQVWSGNIPAGPFTEDTSTSASSKTSLVLYSHNAPISLVTGSTTAELIKPLQYSGYVMAYEFIQAAFVPANYIKHGGDVGSKLVAKLNGSTYDVKNKLYGWIGVV